MREQREGFINVVDMRGTQFWCGHIHKSQDLAQHCRKAFLFESAERSVPLGLIFTIKTLEFSAIANVIPPKKVLLPAPGPFPSAPKVEQEAEAPRASWLPPVRSPSALPALAELRYVAPKSPAPAPMPFERSDTRIDPNPVCRFGPKEGQFLSQIPLYYLKKHVAYVEYSIDDPSKARWLADNQEYLGELNREIDKRHSQAVG